MEVVLRLSKIKSASFKAVAIKEAAFTESIINTGGLNEKGNYFGITKSSPGDIVAVGIM